MRRVAENELNNILVYYGDYKIDNLYEINDFLVNNDIYFYKLQQVFPSGKKQIIRDRYIILTDVYFLLFDPVKDNKNLGKLLFWGDIRQLNNAKGSTDYNNHLIIEWKNNDKIVITFEIIFNSETLTVKDFLEVASRKIIRLKDNFKIFHDELIKNSDLNKTQDLDKLTMLIKFKEDLLLKHHSPNTIRELINLYQKVIEIMTERNDEKFEIYLNKMKEMLQNEDVQKSLEDKTAPIEKQFVLSKSYYTAASDDEKVFHK